MLQSNLTSGHRVISAAGGEGAGDLEIPAITSGIQNGECLKRMPHGAQISKSYW